MASITTNPVHGLPLTNEQVLNLEDVQVSSSVSSRSSSSHGQSECFSFNFRIPRGEQNGKHGYTIPSSIAVSGNPCAFSQTRDPCEAETRVSYVLEATAYRGDCKVATCVKDIRIIDCPDVHPPPVYLAHFPHEYTCSMEKCLKRMRLCETHRLTVSVAEPKPVEVSRKQGLLFAAFPVRFALSPNSKNPKATPKQLNVAIKSQLMSISFISAAPMNGQPTLLQSSVSPLAAAILKNHGTYHRKMLVHWASSNTNQQEARKGAWQHDTVAWLPVCESSMPTPTFFTQYAARRYSVALRFDVQGDGNATFHLTVPLQIVYPADTCYGSPAYEAAVRRSHEEAALAEDNRLPSYVR